MPAFTGQKDLAGYLRALWRWKVVFVLCVLAVPAVAYATARSAQKTYRSTTLIGVGGTTVNGAAFSNGASFATSNVDAIAQLVTTTPIAKTAAGLMEPRADPASIAGKVSAEADQTTNFIRISAEDRDPRRAADIANAFAQAISLNRERVAIRELNATIGGIDAQLARLGRDEIGAKLALRQQLNQLRAARSIQSSNAAILQAATPSSTPTGPGLRRTLEIAALIGLLLGLGAVVVLENSDRKLRAPDDLEAMAEVPLLATIAPSAFSGRLDTGRQDDEAFFMLRAALTYFNAERRIRSVVITSPGEKEGKTTVATRLALAAANSGLNVVLVDGDLRRGQVAVRLALESQEGLGAVLEGERSLADALVDYPLPASGGGHLAVLPAGRPPSNPAALLSSQQIQLVLRRLESENDLVVVDTPAALAVGDPLPLMRSVNGVILVGRVNRSSRRALRRLRQMIADADGTLLGAVATGVTRASGYYDGYSRDYYAHGGSNGSNGHSRSRRRRQAASDESTVSPGPAPPE